MNCLNDLPLSSLSVALGLIQTVRNPTDITEARPIAFGIVRPINAESFEVDGNYIGHFVFS